MVVHIWIGFIFNCLCCCYFLLQSLQPNGLAIDGNVCLVLLSFLKRQFCTFKKFLWLTSQTLPKFSRFRNSEFVIAFVNWPTDFAVHLHFWFCDKFEIACYKFVQSMNRYGLCYTYEFAWFNSALMWNNIKIKWC